jgi:hypothetical protein
MNGGCEGGRLTANALVGRCVMVLGTNTPLVFLDELLQLHSSGLNDPV